MSNANLMNLILLKSLGVNYPILREQNMELTKLVLVVVDEGQMKAVTNLLSNEKTAVMHEIMSVKDITKLLTDSNSTFAVYPYSQSRKGQDFVSFLCTAVKVGEIAGFKMNALPIVVSEGLPNGCDLKKFFTVYLNGNLSSIQVDDTMVVPPDDQLAVVIDKIRSIVTDEYFPDEKALMAAACFLYPNMVSARLKADFKRMIQLAIDLVAADDNNQDANNLSDVFIKSLYNWQEKTGFHDIYELPNLQMEAEKNLDYVILYDDRYLYMKDTQFKDIFSSLLKIFSIDVLKEALVNEEILKPESSRTYTVKIGYYNICGEYKRTRALRFCREKINQVGEVEFIDICAEMKGEY